MRTFALCLSSLFLLACTVTVDEADRTPPMITLSFVTPLRQATIAYEDDGSPVVGNIDLQRSFVIRRQPINLAIDVPFNLLVMARDPESGVRSLDAVIYLDYTCQTRVPGGQVQREITTEVRAESYRRPPPGEDANETMFALPRLSFSDLWRRGNCMNWGQFTDVRSGNIQNVRARIEARASNNAAPPGSSLVTGSFTMPGGYASLSSR